MLREIRGPQLSFSLHATPLESTLEGDRVNVDSKPFVGTLKSFRCNTYKEPGGVAAAVLIQVTL